MQKFVKVGTSFLENGIKVTVLTGVSKSGLQTVQFDGGSIEWWSPWRIRQALKSTENEGQGMANVLERNQAYRTGGI